MSQEGDKKGQFLSRVVRCKTSWRQKGAPKLNELEQLCDSHGKLHLSSMAENSSVLHLYENLIY